MFYPNLIVIFDCLARIDWNSIKCNVVDGCGHECQLKFISFIVPEYWILQLSIVIHPVGVAGNSIGWWRYKCGADCGFKINDFRMETLFNLKHWNFVIRMSHFLIEVIMISPGIKTSFFMWACNTLLKSFQNVPRRIYTYVTCVYPSLAESYNNHVLMQFHYLWNPFSNMKCDINPIDENKSLQFIYTAYITRSLHIVEVKGEFEESWRHTRISCDKVFTFYSDEKWMKSNMSS